MTAVVVLQQGCNFAVSLPTLLPRLERGVVGFLYKESSIFHDVYHHSQLKHHRYVYHHFYISPTMQLLSLLAIAGLASALPTPDVPNGPNTIKPKDRSVYEVSTGAIYFNS